MFFEEIVVSGNVYGSFVGGGKWRFGEQRKKFFCGGIKGLFFCAAKCPLVATRVIARIVKKRKS
jgi:hypothetical protein